MTLTVAVTQKGAQRWDAGHPWIYRSDVAQGDGPAGIVRVTDRRGKYLGQALWSPTSEIRLRLLSRDPEPIDAAWWRRQVGEAASRRANLAVPATAYRVVHGEGDGLPSLIVDRYGDYVVAQLLSAGLESVRADVLAAIEEVLRPKGILLRNDASVRRHEGLPLVIEAIKGTVPDPLEVTEGDIIFEARPHHGQKTGAFLDQRENHVLMGALASGRALDVFTYHGLFALQMARSAASVLAIDSSAEALAAAERNAARNAIGNIIWQEGNAFDLLRELERAGDQFDTIVLDPPAFAKDRRSVDRAFAGYKEINLRAMRLLAPGGLLFTASCSYHVTLPMFMEMLAEAAADAGRALELVQLRGQAADHPTLLTIPESGYLKAAILRAHR
ncbi:MAG: class I SAM-dependent rRNA methyltransferase [Gemmatimonadales bacterium]